MIRTLCHKLNTNKNCYLLKEMCIRDSTNTSQIFGNQDTCYRNFKNVVKVELLRLSPVSYTHLDVYKRQY